MDIMIPIKKQRRSNPSSPSVILPDELITEILSLLSVKNILKLKSVSKSWNTIISDPIFIEYHLKKSLQNPHLALILQNDNGNNVVPFAVNSLLQNPKITVPYHTFQPLKGRSLVVGSCNGLLCLVNYSMSCTKKFLYDKYWFRIWNPATRIMSKKLGSFGYKLSLDHSTRYSEAFKFKFAYVDSTKTYKVVAFYVQDDQVYKGTWKSEVKVFSLGDNRWRDIQSFPVIPLDWLGIQTTRYPNKDGLHLSGTINWLALTNKHICAHYKHELITHVDLFVILSLDLSTETYKQLRLPPGFDEVPQIKPTLSVLMDCLCFYYDIKLTEFVLWQMKEYGVQESWTQLFKISYHNLSTKYFDHNFRLVCLYIDSDMVIFENCNRYPAFIYNLRDSTLGRIKITNRTHGFSHYIKDYVESLVSIC